MFFFHIFGYLEEVCQALFLMVKGKDFIFVPIMHQ